MRALKRHLPDVHFEGIGGSEMQAEGCNSLFPMERLSVLGLTEILGRYFELRRLRKHLIAHFIASPPDIFIGVDSPGFNLGVEEQLRRCRYCDCSLCESAGLGLAHLARAKDQACGRPNIGAVSI